MCGIAGIFGRDWTPQQVRAMVKSQAHRGPDDAGLYFDPRQTAGMGHTRLSIIDLSCSGRQPMSSANGRYWISFNGELYNYLELRRELPDYPYCSQSDTEVILAAFERWGPACLDRFLGMFAFLIWDECEQRLFAARDRFGVKPLYYHFDQHGSLHVASEIKALHASGVRRVEDEGTWASYLCSGAHPPERTFWRGIHALPAGHSLTWQDGRLRVLRWYDPAAGAGQDYDARPLDEVIEEYTALLGDSIRLRFRSDVAVGINLSGGVDSSVLFGLVRQPPLLHDSVKTFTFVTGDVRYDELPWVQHILEGTNHASSVSRLTAAEVPELARTVQYYQDEPFGGLPTLAYGKLFEQAKAEGVTVLLDGQGMDEQWAGYDYYRDCLREGREALKAPQLQGARDAAMRPDCLTPEFRRMAVPFEAPRPFSDALRNAQYRDLCYTKLPRALRFNDRISMMAATELREPFLDHRLVELALRQPPHRKIAGDSTKRTLRRIAKNLCPRKITSAPKRPLQTPQREWLRGELSEWADECIAQAIKHRGGSWFDASRVEQEWKNFLDGQSDNSYYVWQWINLALSQSAPSQSWPARDVAASAI